MTSTEDALLAAIAALPEEDTPRLAYADHLDELGGTENAARAEFIRLQVALYRGTFGTREAAAARRRTAELQQHFSAAWGFPEQTGYFPWYTVRRGFIDELIVDRALPVPVCRLLRCEPVTRLKIARQTGFVAGPRSDTVDWLDLPALAKVRHIEISGSDWSDENVNQLLSFAHFPALAGLAVLGTSISPVGISALANCPRLAGLASLRINFNYRGGDNLLPQQPGVFDAGAEALAASAPLAALRELALRDGRIETAGARALAGSPFLTKLTSLILTENPGIGPAGRSALVARFGDAVFLSPPPNP